MAIRTPEERVEFGAKIAQLSQAIVNQLIQSDLSPFDSAFTLGASINAVIQIVVQMNPDIEETKIREDVMMSFHAGMKNVTAVVSIVGKAH